MIDTDAFCPSPLEEFSAPPMALMRAGANLVVEDLAVFVDLPVLGG